MSEEGKSHQLFLPDLLVGLRAALRPGEGEEGLNFLLPTCLLASWLWRYQGVALWTTNRLARGQRARESGRDAVCSPKHRRKGLHDVALHSLDPTA